MKNLELLELVRKPITDPFPQTKLFIQTPDAVYFILNNSLHKYDLIHNTRIEVCPKPFEDAICIKLLTIEGKICVVTPGTLYILNPDGIDEVQSITFQKRIVTISWNPTEEVVVTVSQDGEVVTYSIDYENAEVYPQGCSSVNAKIPDTVYVGWGSKDTQFRGLEGKIKKNERPIEGKPIDDRKPSVSWRGNGEMFVVNYWQDYKRIFVVFETPCKAMYRSETCSGLQPTVAWRPTGNMIATLAELANKQSVVIFEKNGQKRFSFDLNFGEVIVRELKWSPCSQILTIYSESPSSNSQNIHLLMSSNYQWYEKQTLTFTSNNPLLDYDWSETTQFTFTLRVVMRNEIVNYTFRNVINNSQAKCAVINGKILQLTDFSDAVIPPTLYSKQFVNDKSINFVFINGNRVAIVDSGNCLKMFDFENPEIVLSTVNFGEIVDNLLQFPLACHHFVSKGYEVYLAAETDAETVFYGLNTQNNELNFINATNDPVKHFVIAPKNCEIISMKQIGDFLFINDDSFQNSIQETVAIVDDMPYNYQLTSSCHFYVNCHKICDSVNSFLVFNDYLLFTTKLNELYCVRLTRESMGILSEGGLSQNYRRSVEQGATIVTGIPNSPKIALQLPRGNLETISCRLISIDILDRLLSDGKWEEALRFIRLEKLNANLLFDLDSNRFLTQVDRFVSAVETVNELNSVCLEIEEVNVLKTLYKNWGRCEEFPEKIPTIFGKILEYFDRVDYAPYITTIMIINLHFFALRDALIYVQDLLKRSRDDVDLKKSVVEAVNTLKTYGCDQEKLYTEALLLYNLDLARFVATCCQMDPRIYEPHLNNLKNLSEVERRYEINLYGKRPKIAVAYMLRCPKFDSREILSFIRTHRVSREAYERCGGSNMKHYQVVSMVFAEDLSRKGCHHESGVVLKKAGLLEEALEEFKLGLRWREVLDLLKELQVEEMERSRIINEMAGRLMQHHMVKDAAVLYEYYANNYEMAAKILTDNYLFHEAVHLAKKYNRNDIIVADIIPSLNKQKTHLEEKLTDLDGIFDKYRTRLAQVRRSRAAKFNNFGDEGDDRDSFSDAGSVASRSSRSSKSRSSTASSRSRRKEEKKKQDLRQGGIYEDIALIRALHCLIREVYSKGEEVRSCCIFLLQESDVPFREIRLLHDLYFKIDRKIKNSLTEIWPPHFYLNNNTQDVQELADLANFEYLDIEFRTPPSGYSNWSLNLFGD